MTSQVLIPIVASGLVLAVFNQIYLSVFMNPYIEIKLIDKTPTISQITVRNLGNVPVWNVTLTIITPEPFRNYTLFSSEPIRSVSQMESQLSLSLPRLSQGNGSLVEVGIISMKNFTKSPFVYITHNEGSLTSSDRPNILTLLLSMYSGYAIIAWILISFFSLWAYMDISRTIYHNYVGTHRDDLIFSIKQSVMIVINTLKKNNEFLYSFRTLNDYYIRPGKFGRGSSIWLLGESDVFPNKILLKNFDKMHDFNIIQDFFVTIGRRERYLKETAEKDQYSKLTHYNQNCLSQAEKALNEIDWNHYVKI